ncbi:alpha/beta hydrolase [Rhizosphaericola mali]|uniref:Alpha/beta hydrolase n=1 Tax=Rhizosphaericola mali TaxID=2545455 RepID=A0A5P2G7N8_9BACT|nr:alpha/beta hydrolase [Rhizosphaericola mali]QES89942.1 alpha/beta hydrolase [Rhizosphaericola mali]
MSRKWFLLLIVLIFNSNLYSQMKESDIELNTTTGNIFGTLTEPEKMAHKIPIVLIIAGSGPTDRNGNNPFMSNNSLKYLADSLANHNIASVRYDKRGVGASIASGTKEEDVRFNNYIDDAVKWIKLLNSKNKYSKVIVFGHSEGSLIGMIAAKIGNANMFISMAGAGESADEILKNQLSSQPLIVQKNSFPIIDSLKHGKLVSNIPESLNTLFRPSVQPYMISWFKYDPQFEIKKLNIPILILQGDNDIQIGVKDAENLHAANSKSQLIILKNVNHIMKTIVDRERQANIATYNNPDLPISELLVTDIVKFIND